MAVSSSVDDTVFLPLEPADMEGRVTSKMEKRMSN